MKKLTTILFIISVVYACHKTTIAPASINTPNADSLLTEQTKSLIVGHDISIIRYNNYPNDTNSIVLYQEPWDIIKFDINGKCYCYTGNYYTTPNIKFFNYTGIRQGQNGVDTCTYSIDKNILTIVGINGYRYKGPFLLTNSDLSNNGTHSLYHYYSQIQSSDYLSFIIQP